VKKVLDFFEKKHEETDEKGEKRLVLKEITLMGSGKSRFFALKKEEFCIKTLFFY